MMTTPTNELTTNEKQRLLEQLKDARDKFRHLEVICARADLPVIPAEAFLNTLYSYSWNSAPKDEEDKIISALEAHLTNANSIEDIRARRVAELTAPAPVPPPDRGRKPFPASAASVWERLVTSWQTYGRTLPTDSAFRKEFPIESGVNRYFPAAIVCMAAWSKFNNNKHNPGEPLHHSRNKSSDHEECVVRHNFDIADAQRRVDDLTELEEATAVFWRAGARLQILCERLGAPLAPAARVAEPAPGRHDYAKENGVDL